MAKANNKYWFFFTTLFSNVFWCRSFLSQNLFHKIIFSNFVFKIHYLPHMISLAPQAWQCWLTAHRFTWGENSFYNLESQQLRVISDATIINISEHLIWQETFGHNKDPPWITAMEYRSRDWNAGNTGNRGNVIFQGMLPNIPGNVLKHFGKCRQTFWGMSSNIPRNVLKYSGSVAKYTREYRQIIRGMLANISGNVAKYSGKCPQIFRGKSPNIPGNVAKYSVECCQTFPGMSSNILGNIPKHSMFYSPLHPDRLKSK